MLRIFKHSTIGPKTVYNRNAQDRRVVISQSQSWWHDLVFYMSNDAAVYVILQRWQHGTGE